MVYYYPHALTPSRLSASRFWITICEKPGFENPADVRSATLCDGTRVQLGVPDYKYWVSYDKFEFQNGFEQVKELTTSATWSECRS